MRKRLKTRIKDLPLDSRPREKLFARGKENVSNAELIAILLGTGTRAQNAIMIAQSLLRNFTLEQLAKITFEQFAKFPGIGRTKAARILAALELGERIFKPSSLQKTFIRSTDEAVVHLKEITNKRQEFLLVFYLNARHELLLKETVGQGSLNSMLITPKEIFSPALLTPCASIIIAHNHPSGDPNPSHDDISFTEKIHEAGELMGIPLIDHIIISNSGYFSFRENNVVK